MDNRPLKRLFDIFLSGIGLIVSSWFWVFIWIAIAIEDGFPVIIRQERIGKYGKLFKNYKFRSMKKSTLKEKVKIQAVKDDLRITRVGRILRKCALDELPQLINIFIGQMSFVGPRALLPEEKEVHSFGNAYTNGGTLAIENIPGYAKRITVKPGLTGIAQIWASRDIPRRHKFKYDLLYIRKRAFWLDLKLILISFLVTFRSRWERREAKLGLLQIRTNRIKKYAYAWLPVAAYIGVLFVAANILLTNENTLRIINYVTAWMAPDTNHATVCMVVGKTRDWSHILIYAVFMYLIFRAFKKTCKKTMLCYVVMAGICALGFGVLDEVAQMLVAGRSASITDWCIDVMGVVVGIGLIFAKNKNHATLETHPHKVD